MRDPKRINRCLRRIKEVWSKYPDLRLGQLLINITPDARSLYFVEDEDLVDLLEKFYNKEDIKDN